MQFSIVSLKCRLTCRAKLTTALHVQELMKNNKNHINFKGSKLKLNFLPWSIEISLWHYCNAIMGTVASQITSLTIVYSTVYSDADQRKHQSSASLAFVWGIHRGPVTGEFPAQMASNAENASIWGRHHGFVSSTVTKHWEIHPTSSL